VPFLEARRQGENVFDSNEPVRPLRDEVCQMCESSEIEINVLGEHEGDVIHGGDEPEKVRGFEQTGVLRKLIDPRLPTQREVDEHNLTHLPYRNWCPVCVKAKGKDLDHRAAVDKDREFLSIV